MYTRTDTKVTERSDAFELLSSVSLVSFVVSAVMLSAPDRSS